MSSSPRRLSLCAERTLNDGNEKLMDSTRDEKDIGTRQPLSTECAEAIWDAGLAALSEVLTSILMSSRA